MAKFLIVGGGAAGMMAAVHAARGGHEVHLFEKNEKLGKKLYITGKGRCNLTNDCATEELFSAIVSNPKFLYSAFYAYPSQAVMNFFEEADVPLKVERGNRVFPKSDHSSDIISGLARQMQRAGVQIHLNTEVKRLLCEGGADQRDRVGRWSLCAIRTCTGGDWRTVLSIHRVYGRRIPVCKRVRTYRDFSGAFFGPADGQRGLYTQAAGPFFEKCLFDNFSEFSKSL